MSESEHPVQPAPGRVVVRGPQVAPTVAEVLGDPRRGHIQERHRAAYAQALRHHQLRGNLLGLLLLVAVLTTMWLLAHSVALIAVVLVYPCMAVLALWLLRRAGRMESS